MIRYISLHSVSKKKNVVFIITSISIEEVYSNWMSFYKKRSFVWSVGPTILLLNVPLFLKKLIFILWWKSIEHKILLTESQSYIYQSIHKKIIKISTILKTLWKNTSFTYIKGYNPVENSWRIKCRCLNLDLTFIKEYTKCIKISQFTP